MTLRRRSLLTGTAAVLLGPVLPARTATASGLPAVALLPPGKPDRRLFTFAEQRFGSYLVILAPMANDIETDDPATYGFMAGGWWRTPNAPYNARVQEHVFTLSWFYANEREWNPYYRDPALLGRLDAALQHYLRLQNPDGSWPEYAPGERGKASSGFGLGYLAKTLKCLRQADALPQRRGQLAAALRRGVTWYLDPANRVVWDDPFEYTNQAAAGLAGSALTLALLPDAAMTAALNERVEFMAAYGQSPAGFFYDPRGMDINYNFEVMLPELAELYALTGNRTLVSMARKFSEWFGYNLLREPDGAGWLTYYAVSDRTAAAAYDDVIADPDRSNLGSLFVPAVPSLAAFYTSREDRARTRAGWAADPDPVPPLAKQDTSPRIIAHVGYGEALPGRQPKQAAIRQLPYLRSRDFAEVRRDAVERQDYLYARRSDYYFGAFFGDRPGNVVKAGTGFLWHPAAGTVIHAQQTPTGCWGSVRSGQADADGNLSAEHYRIGGRGWDGRHRALGDAALSVRYRTPDGTIATELVLDPHAVVRRVTASSAATEQVPLVLQPGDGVTFSDGTSCGYGESRDTVADGLVLRRGPATVTVRWGRPCRVSLSSTSRTYLRDGRRRVHMLRVDHDGRLTTTVRVD